MDYIQAALDEGFLHAAILSTRDIPFEESFRAYCEENLCGQYDANYTCPPACGPGKVAFFGMILFDGNGDENHIESFA